MSADNWAYCPKCQADETAQDTQRPEFREDYEIWGADEGVVQWSYSGHCRLCGLGTDFRGSRALL